MGGGRFSAGVRRRGRKGLEWGRSVQDVSSMGADAGRRWGVNGGGWWCRIGLCGAEFGGLGAPDEGCRRRMGAEMG